MNISRVRLLLLVVPAFAVLTASCGGAGKPKEIPTGPQPVVIVALDGLRATDIGAFGGKGAHTSNLDALAKESVAFANAFAQTPLPVSGLATLLTGLYPGSHGVQGTGQPLRPEARTLAELLLEKGYTTAAFVDGEGVTSEMGFGQGFSTFEARSGAGLRDVGGRALEWLRAHGGERFLVLIEASDLNRAGATPESAVSAVDGFFGELTKAFRDLGLDRKAVLVVLGTEGNRVGDPSGPRLQPGLVHVPMMIRFPGGAQARRIDEIAEVVDAMPTIADLAGVAPPENVQGRSLMPLVRGQGKPPYIAFGEAPPPSGERFVALGGYELIQPESQQGLVLYRLTDPPEEVQQPAASEAKRVEVLQDHLTAWDKLIASTSLDPTKQTKPLDEKTLEQLKSLGYVQ